MALKVELKAGEKIIIGQSVLTNGDARARFTIDGDTPILREKDVMTLDEANSPAKLLYLHIQVMYLENSIETHHEKYVALAQSLLDAAPSMAPHIQAINNHILTGDLYKSIKDAKQLITYEKELINHATSDSN